MTDQKVHLTRETETYLPTLYGKALDCHAEDSILKDTYADDVVRHIDFDFKKLHLANGGEITLPMRALHLDNWAREYLAAHPSATLLDLGCGLDSRIFRIDPPATVRCYDVDLPEVIALRRQLYPERHDYILIATSVSDLHWLDQVPGDRPVMVVAEGLMQYLSKQEVSALFTRITQQFPSGQIVFDAYSNFTTGTMNFVFKVASLRSKMTSAGTTIHLPWGLDDPHEIEKLAPRLHLISAVPFLTLPELVRRLTRSKYQAFMYKIFPRFAWYRNAMRHYRYEF